MLTSLVANATPLTNDHALMSSVARRRVPATGGAPSFCLGIEGPEGEVYRVIQSDSLCEVVWIFEALQRDGLVVDAGRYVGGRKLLRVFRSRS